MQNIYVKSFSLRTSDFDCYRKITPASVLDLFQTVAGEHAAELGCGFDDLFARKLLWVLVRTKYQVIRQPEMYQTVRVKTWPLAPSRIGFQREYLMEDENGNALIKGSSDWVVIHSEQRKIVSAADIYPNIELLTEKNFEEKLKKLPNFEADEDGFLICPGFSQLDMNGHVNNTKYANFALDAINPSEQKEIISFQMDYRHEVQKGDNIKVYTKKEGNTALAKGVNSADVTMFVCKIDFKP
ncbi:MAG: hypothetical protein J6C29_06605 [Clostridia bacterium]|nr:hypothetical protein [Clostridia bacterium]